MCGEYLGCDEKEKKNRKMYKVKVESERDVKIGKTLINIKMNNLSWNFNFLTERLEKILNIL